MHVPATQRAAALAAGPPADGPMLVLEVWEADADGGATALLGLVQAPRGTPPPVLSGHAASLTPY
jgi:hypothetical protein